MNAPGKIQKLDEVVVNRIAAGEVIQRPANALKELIENSLDAKATNIQIIAKEGGLKLLQIQDNGTGIRKDDMDIVCERFTTSKLQTFEDLKTIATFGFRGEALASISHVALLTITTKTTNEKCAYKASYIDSKLKDLPKPCAGNQGTIITIENLFYNVATRRKALSNVIEEFSKITDVVTKYAIHNPTVGFVLKKHGDITPQVRTAPNSTKMNNVRVLYGNPVFRELLEVELTDEAYKFKMHALITNPNYTNKRMVFLLFINNRLVDSSTIRKMLEELYTFYLPKKTHPWCYISLEIEPQNIDVNVHPTKHEVRFLHENSIIERIKSALDEKLSGNSASRTFYVQARLPQADITKEVLEEVLPEYEQTQTDKTKKIRPKEMIRTDSSDQKLGRFNFTIHTAMKHAKNDDSSQSDKSINNSTPSQLISTQNVLHETLNSKRGDEDTNNSDQRKIDEIQCLTPDPNVVDKLSHVEISNTPWSDMIDETSPSTSSQLTVNNTCNIVSSTLDNDMQDMNMQYENLQDIFENINNESAANDSVEERCIDEIADKARKQVYQRFGSKSNTIEENKCVEKFDNKSNVDTINLHEPMQIDSNKNDDAKSTQEFKSYSINNFRRELKLTSILKLRKEVENECHEGLRQILSDLTFVGCIDESSALVQSGVNLYLCNTKKLAEELFYEIMLYDFANYGVIRFSDEIPLYDLALLGLDTEESGWTEKDGDKKELATNAKELLLEKADMLKEYFSIVIDKKGNLKSLPVLIEKYFPYEAGLPLYILRLATEVEWSAEQPCFKNVCRETARYYSQMNPVHNNHDWKYITEHVLYPVIKESLLPPKHFVHDSTILQIANLPDLYKVFERC
ncbi:PREDICTED: DNA mismatch repair protein Mlh1 [Dufourea novaeangliae]|uniref:DNA mismatch repair protein Mlh1 n=1 Tax=Dufourea novaeangliae TaxID=178035 RepID=UPI0007677707|nr:PREDICTED: DNA mismatch repair protein Mlh1 [Dufourea novaeangliae]